MAEEDREEKQLKDFTELVNSSLPALVDPVKGNPSLLDENLEKLLALEKKTRLAADAISTEKIALAIIGLLHDLQKWTALNEHIALLCKRRAQLKKVIQSIIQMGVKWVESTPTEQIKRDLIGTLRTVSAGKLFVEVERARMTRILADLEEKDGKVSEACDILQEVQVETIGAMEIREKAEFLLEQFRLCLAKKDYIRAELVAKKVNAKVLEGEEMQDLKIKYYTLMIEFYQINSDYFSICKAYRNIFNTPRVQQNPAQWKEALKSAVVYLVLSPFDSESSDLLHRVKAEKKIHELPSCKLALDLFTTDELISWPMKFDAEWKADSIFAGKDGEKRYGILRKRVIQHSIRTVSGYYHRIRTSRLANLLSLAEEQTEEHLSELVSSKQLYAKIDRPAGIITFTRPETPDTTINHWANDISDLLTLVEKTCHLINKENMLHKIGQETD